MGSRLQIIFIGALMGFVPTAHGVMELSGSFGYDKQVYGASKRNKATTRTFTGSWAIFLFSRVALEFNYQVSDQTITESEVVETTSSEVVLESAQSIVETEVYGVGLRALLANRRSRIVPSISLGYAKQFIESQSEYTFRLVSTGEIARDTDPVRKDREDSVFGTISLQFRLLNNFGLNVSVQTLFPAFEFNKASDDLKYLAGFSWIF